MANTPLMQAVVAENLDLVKILLESGNKAGINDSYDYAKLTPLIIAIEKQNLDLIKLLLENGAKEAINTPVKVLDPTGGSIEKTFLKCAIDTGNLDIIKLLIENGANDGSPGASNNTATTESPTEEKAAEYPLPPEEG
ncbi:MAG: ankyrin repeat domain-containing protein [Holosporales bacterium]|jgi:ankyrin repeat protein|nr:ankyrin repeat domain-containing protein [Holosporales bacterium]